MKGLGFGLGLRSDHYDTILTELPPIGFFEALTEIYLVPGGKALHYLNRVREKYPLVLHGVSLSIGSTQPINRDYLKALKYAHATHSAELDLRPSVLDRHRLERWT